MHYLSLCQDIFLIWGILAQYIHCSHECKYYCTYLTSCCFAGHKRSQSGSYVPPRPWAGLYQHRRSHSTSGYHPLPCPAPPPPPTGILATQPGHQRRASSGQQVTFRGLAEDPNDLTGVRVVVHGAGRGGGQGDELEDEEGDLAIKV